ncbi:MAG: HAMP domain-containing sensor histidine kinase [Pseudomonadota bacterium]
MTTTDIVVSPFRALQRSYYEFHGRAPFKLPYIGALGIIAHPIYYVLWAYLLPQPFESLSIRLGCMLLCIALAVERWWPLALKRFYLPFAYVALMVCLPIFFTYMLLKNNATDVWLMSATVATLFLVLLYDFRNALITLGLGNALGVFFFIMTDGLQPLPISYALSIPVYLFAILAVGFLTYSERQIAEEKLHATQALAANIAHEMRTPLLSIQLDCEQMEDELQNGPNPLRRPDTALDISSLARAVKRVRNQAHGAGIVIDMILFNVKHEHIQPEIFEEHSMSAAVKTAVARFPFQNADRACIHLELEQDFRYFGSDVLMVHVFFNLIKNAIIAGSGTDALKISIKTEVDPLSNIVRVTDNGMGIPPELWGSLFEPFATSGKRMEGSGLGLAFCKNVINSFGGTITYQTAEGSGTTFEIRLPFSEQVDANGRRS